MTIAEKIEKLKQLFMGAVPPGPVTPPAPAPAPAPPAPAEFKDYTAADGVTVLSIDKLEVGGKVNINGAPAPDGEYQLQDGTKVKVAAGLISELEAAEPAPPVPAPPPAAPPTPQQMRETLQHFAENGSADLKALTLIVQYLFEDRFGWELKREEEEAKRTLAIETYKNSFEEQTRKNEKAFNSIIEIMTDFASVEKSEPVAKPQSFRKDPQEKQSRLDKIAEKLKEMSNKN